MKSARNLLIGTIAALLCAPAGFSSSLPNSLGTSAGIVVTALPAKGTQAPQNLGIDDLAVTLNNNPARVLQTQPFSGDRAPMQLFVLLDDSTRSSSLSLQLGDLKRYIASLPTTTQVAVGYMQNGTARRTQNFTTDHQKAANSLRLPEAVPGENGSPYFALSDLVKHWPSKQPTGRRTVLMLTDGVDRYFGTSIVEDPYVDAAIHDALKAGVQVYSIYLRGSGFYGRGDWTTNIAQSRLIQVTEATGGYSYFMDFTDPVSIAPFLEDLQSRLAHQYQVTIQASNKSGVQRLEVRSELPGLKLVGPTRIYLP